MSPWPRVPGANTTVPTAGRSGSITYPDTATGFPSWSVDAYSIFVARVLSTGWVRRTVPGACGWVENCAGGW